MSEFRLYAVCTLIVTALTLFVSLLILFSPQAYRPVLHWPVTIEARKEKIAPAKDKTEAKTDVEAPSKTPPSK
jgi:hypothetical protein